MPDNKTKDNVVKLTPAKAKKASESKWGKPVMDLGFSIVPSLLFKAQRRLHLEPRHMGVLVQLLDFYWEDGRYPYPTKALLAERCNISPRQLQRIIVDMEEAGLVKRIERHHAGTNGKIANIYDLSGLEAKLKELEPDFTDVKKKAKAQRKDVATPGHKMRKRLKKASSAKAAS